MTTCTRDRAGDEWNDGWGGTHEDVFWNGMFGLQGAKSVSQVRGSSALHMPLVNRSTFHVGRCSLLMGPAAHTS